MVLIVFIKNIYISQDFQKPPCNIILHYILFIYKMRLIYEISMTAILQITYIL